MICDTIQHSLSVIFFQFANKLIYKCASLYYNVPKQYLTSTQLQTLNTLNLQRSSRK